MKAIKFPVFGSWAIKSNIFSVTINISDQVPCSLMFALRCVRLYVCVCVCQYVHVCVSVRVCLQLIFYYLCQALGEAFWDEFPIAMRRLGYYLAAAALSSSVLVILSFSWWSADWLVDKFLYDRGRPPRSILQGQLFNQYYIILIN